ncbi:hypothetical protein GCM10010975_07350 [Comamonas phosphati]|nr:hypothetical protein GCM10010975_07350 [Comamonas phosphati]
MMPAQPSSIAPAARQQLGGQARLRWAHGIAQGLPAIAQQLDFFLGQPSGSSGTQKQMQEQREAWEDFQAHKAAWLQGSVQALQQAARQPSAAPPPARSATPLTFELLSDDVVENKLLASRLALTMGEATQPGFDAMRARMQALEGRELPARDIFRVETVCLHLTEQWTASGMRREHLQRCAQPLQQALGSLLAAQFDILHQLLDARGVPQGQDGAMKVKRAAGTPGTSGIPGAPTTRSMHLPANAAPGGAWPGAARGQSPEELPEESAGLNVLARARQRAQDAVNQLRRVLSQPAIGMPAPVPGRMPGTHAAPVAPASAALAQALREQQLAAITQYEHLASRGPGAPMAVDYSPAALEHLAQLVRERSASWKQKAATNSEKATIEVVALMFQSILSEDRIPPSIRVWFARLQVPVLRVALAEPEFFGDLAHPARKLIDRMGSCVMGFDASSISGSALEVEIRRVVQVIEQYPETGQKVFALVLREFEDFLSGHLTQTPSTASIASVAQQVEQKETLAIQYTIELRNLLTDMPVREEIRDFLFKSWADVLAMATVRHGARDARAMRFKQAASELVWAASAKPSRQERARVIQALPALLQTLREGLALVNVTGSEQSARIKKLTDTLAEAFVAKAAAIPAARIEAMARRLAELEQLIGEDGGLEDTPLSPENIEMLLGVDTAGLKVIANTHAPVDASMLEWARALETGRWFTLDHNGTRVQVQYAWQSRRKQLHLFAALDGKCYLLQLQRMAAYLQAGLLAVHDEEALTVRATRDALQKIQANPERLI